MLLGQAIPPEERYIIPTPTARWRLAMTSEESKTTL
jgi:hypothetical protein